MDWKFRFRFLCLHTFWRPFAYVQLESGHLAVPSMEWSTTNTGALIIKFYVYEGVEIEVETQGFF